MKRIRTLFAFALAFVAVFALALPAALAEDGNAAIGGTITINVPDDTTEKTVYSIYKVFDATVDVNDPSKVSYTLPSGKSLSEDMQTYFSVDAAGNVTVMEAAKDTNGKLNGDAINAIKAFVANDVATATAEAVAGAATATSKTLPYGYYFISTTTGSVVTIDTNNDSPTVDDKNSLSVVVKSAGTVYNADSMKAIAAAGSEQDFTAQITVGAGATSLVFRDYMKNMTYVADSLTVKKNNIETALTAGTDYTVEVANDSASFSVTFQNVSTAFTAYDTITLNYKGLVTSDALSVNPAENKAKLTTDNGNTSESEIVKVYNAKLTITKRANSASGALLGGAGFVVKNFEGKYYKFNNANNVQSISWYGLKTNETLEQAIADGNITEYKSNDSGEVTAFTGLADGTYTLVESTVPAGYNKAEDYTFTINNANAEADFTTTNLEQTSTVVNKQGVEMPSTGGIGTTIFYVVGGVLVVGAVLFLLTKRRAAAE